MLIAFVVLLASLVATSSLVATGLKVGTDSRLKQVATDIASSQLDSEVHAGAAALLAQETYTTSVSRGGVRYTLESNVTPYASGSGACQAPAAGQPVELLVSVWVTWAGGVTGQWWYGATTTSKLVQESTLVPVPATALTAGDGSILVSVTDDADNGQSGVDVTLNGTTEWVDTNGSGCAFFPNLAPGTYSVTATKAGWIDSNNDMLDGAPADPTWSGTLLANQVLYLPLTAPLYYAASRDRQHHVRATLTRERAVQPLRHTDLVLQRRSHHQPLCRDDSGAGVPLQYLHSQLHGCPHQLRRPIRHARRKRDDRKRG